MRPAWASRQKSAPWPLLVGLSLFLHLFVLLGFFGLSKWTNHGRPKQRFLSVQLLASTPVQSPKPLATRSSIPHSAPRFKAKVSIPSLRRKRVAIAPRKLELPSPKAVKKVTRPTLKATQPAPKDIGGRKVEGGKAGTQVAASSGQISAIEFGYLKMLQQRIEENWRAYLPEGKGVVGEVEIQLSADGTIEHLRFRRGYGKGQVDESIVRALRRVVLPPPPRGLVGIPLVLRFWSSGGP